MVHKMSKMQSNTLSIRFSSDKQLSFLKEVEELALRTGGKPGPFMRNLAIIGYAFFKQGANLGFDGEVVVNGTVLTGNGHNNDIPTEDFGQSAVKQTDIPNEAPIAQKQKSAFLD